MTPDDTTTTPSKPPAVVMPFPVRVPLPATADLPAQSSFNKQVLTSLAAASLAPAVHEADALVDQAHGEVHFSMLTPEQRAAVFDRSVVAVHLGDPIKRTVADEKAALAILRAIDGGIRAGNISRQSPLALLDITSARVVAKFAMAGGLGVFSRRRPVIEGFAGAWCSAVLSERRHSGVGAGLLTRNVLGGPDRRPMAG